MIETATKSIECFTLYQYKKEWPKNIGMFTSMYLEVWLFEMEKLDKKCFHKTLSERKYEFPKQ